MSPSVPVRPRSRDANSVRVAPELWRGPASAAEPSSPSSGRRRGGPRRTTRPRCRAGAALDGEVAAAGQAHRVAPGRPVERLGDRGAPVDHDRFTCLVGHGEAPDVEALERIRRLGVPVDAPEHERRVPRSRWVRRLTSASSNTSRSKRAWNVPPRSASVHVAHAPGGFTTAVRDSRTRDRCTPALRGDRGAAGSYQDASMLSVNPCTPDAAPYPWGIHSAMSERTDSRTVRSSQ